MPDIEADARAQATAAADARSTATARGLRALIRADRPASASPELEEVLRAIVHAAMDTVGARYGALAVLDDDGALAEFVHAGLTDDEVAAMPRPPEGLGLMAALSADPRPIRLSSLADDPRSAGFPDGHVSMTSFLGIAIRVRERVYGHLYLADQVDGQFRPEDEGLITSLSIGAGFAIENARLLAHAQQREQWAGAAARITAALLPGNAQDAVAPLVDAVARLAHADLACALFQPASHGSPVVVAAAGDGAAGLQGARCRSRQVRDTRTPRRVSAFQPDGERTKDWPDGPALIIPFATGEDHPALLLAVRTAPSREFSAFDLEQATDLATQAGRAMELATTRADRQRVVLLEDRARIARDLHDHVIQQLFAIGLDLQAVAQGIGPGEAAARIDAHVSGIDDTIGQIRTIVFALSHGPTDLASVRQRVLQLADEVGGILPHPAHVTFAGPVDLVVDESLAADMLAVVREGLTNVGRHARAGEASVHVAVTAESVVLTISDDGVGIGDAVRRSGLANCAARARSRGGSFAVESDAAGTRLRWTVPVGG